MAYWVGIESRWDWWSTMTPSMANISQFWLNHIMSCNRFHYVTSALSFTNREVPYEDGLFHMRQSEEYWNHNMSQQFFHYGSILLISSWWSGLTSGILDLCGPALSRIPLEMIVIPFVVLSPPFCREKKLWKVRTGELKSVWRNGKSWEILFASCYECASQYFNWKLCCAWKWLLCVKGYHILVGFWCLHCCDNKEAQILTQECTRRYH